MLAIGAGIAGVTGMVLTRVYGVGQEHKGHEYPLPNEVDISLAVSLPTTLVSRRCLHLFFFVARMV